MIAAGTSGRAAILNRAGISPEWQKKVHIASLATQLHGGAAPEREEIIRILKQGVLSALLLSTSKCNGALLEYSDSLVLSWTQMEILSPK